MTSTSTRHSQLLSVKLGALVTEHIGSAAAAPFQPRTGFGGGTTSAALGVADDQVWALLNGPDATRRRNGAEFEPRLGLGAVLAWTTRHEPGRAVNVVCDDPDQAGAVARQAASMSLSLPVRSWTVDGRQIRAAEPTPLSAVVVPAARHVALIETIEAAGATAVIEHGVVSGEVRGLEVCRVVDDGETVRLEVGVGAHDRETFQLLHGDRPTVEALADVVAAVARHRHRGAAPHPLNVLARERALRATLIEQPDLIGAERVVAAEPPVPRRNVKDAVPCAARATVDGVLVTVAVSTGIDLELVPWAVDARSFHADGQAHKHGASRLMLVVPTADAVAPQRRLVDLVAEQAMLVAVDAP